MGEPPRSRPALSAGHGASLSTTAGITAVITGVLAVALLAQAGPTPHGLAGPTIACLVAGAGGLYAARNAVGQALDAAADPARAARLGARALMRYHLGMAGVFAGLAGAAAWRLGNAGWPAAGVAGLLALAALVRALAWRS
jgi:hypothetical protein